MPPQPERQLAEEETGDTHLETGAEDAAPEGYTLPQRVMSATLLLPTGVLAIWLGGIALAAVIAAAGVVMAYEWARMQEPRKPAPHAFVLAIGAVVCPVLATFGHFQWTAPFLAACAMVAAFLRPTWIGRLESFGGAVYVGAPGAAFIWIRNRPDDGLILALGIAVAVWASDIAAYFVGRALGGPKLSPETSPKKTWSGFFGGVIAGALAAAAFGWGTGAYWPLGLIAGALISVVGQTGDMFESIVKRHFRVKDTSGLIPGHGGVMDRLDAFMAASIVSAIVLRWASTLSPEINFASATLF